MITSWNAGAQTIYGYTADEIIGEPMSTLLADNQIDEWPANLAKLRKGVPITNFDISRTTKDDRAIHLSLMISPIRDEKGVIVGASAVARDIAERKAAEERALLLMAELDHRVKNILAVVSSVVTQTLRSGGPPESFSTEIEGRILAIARAHNLLTEHGGTEGSLRELVATEARPYEQHNNVNLAGPNVVLTSKASLTLALAIHELATNAAKYGSLSIPTGKLDVSWRVVGDGLSQLLEIDFRILIGEDVRWISARGQGDDANIADRVMFGIFLDVSGRKQAEEGHELLAGEMSHRVKNLLAIASGLTHITSRSTTTAAEMAHQLTQRLTALGRAHDLVRPVPGNEGRAALLGDLFTVLLAPYDDLGAFSGRIRVAVPRMGVGESTATTLALVVHELATNSVKYGALSADAGTLDVSCLAEETDATVVWTERGGPPVVAPHELGGFGSKLVARSIAGQLGGSIEYDWSPNGLIVTLHMRKDRLAA